MEDEQKDYEMTLQKFLTGIIFLSGFFGVIALIWLVWTVFQVCLTAAFLAIVGKLFLPEDW